MTREKRAFVREGAAAVLLLAAGWGCGARFHGGGIGWGVLAMVTLVLWLVVINLAPGPNDPPRSQR